MGDEKLRADFGKLVSLHAALKLKKMSLGAFISLRSDHITETRECLDATLKVARPELHKDGLDVVGLPPCPVRLPLLEGCNDFAETMEKDGIKLNTDLKPASMGV